MVVSLNDAVQTASGELAIEAGAKRIGKSVNVFPFVPHSSKIVGGRARRFIESHFDEAHSSSTTVRAAADYLVLTAWAHTLDSWRFLSSAAMSLITASRTKALHLAYYAELRAALSILAVGGICILKDKHYALTSAGEVKWFGGSTHKCVWEALDGWSQIRANATGIIGALNTRNILGIDWIEACRATLLPDEIASNWLNDWAFDLRQFLRDRDLRNEASYRPDFTTGGLDPVVRRDIDIVRDVNVATGANGLQSGDMIDIVLVLDLCESMSAARCGTGGGKGIYVFWGEILQWLIAHGGKTRAEAAEVIRFVRSSRATAAGRILREADETNRGASGVFCRALFLLRMASGMLRIQRQEMSRRAPSGELIWPGALLSQFGLHCLLWEAEKEPVDYSTLEQDKNDADDELSNWVAVTPFSGFRMWADKASAAAQICRLERLGLMLVAT